MLRTVCLGGIALLAAAKLWAGITGDLAATMAEAGKDPFGIVALIALYSGMAGFLIVMFRLEPDRRIAFGVLAATPLVGNMAPALWLALRGLDLIRSRRVG
ncbi:MAG: hypothetical protein NT037_04130 [Hyphomicrobiales bacterium]|nr:hypothetical protein [Hyphomicrobiales bacterium]